MATTTWSSSIGHIIMSTLSCHAYEGHTDKNAPLSGKYTVDYLHISPTSFFGSNYTSDDLWPELYGIYLIIIPNETEFYELQVVQIVVHKVNPA